MNVQAMKGSVGSLSLGTGAKGGVILRVGVDINTDPGQPEYGTLQRLVPEIGALLRLAEETAEEEPAEGQARTSRKSELFVDGSRFGHGKDHKVKLWGLPPSTRQEEAQPVLETVAASVGKKVSILFGTNDHARIRLVIAFKGSMIPDLSFRTLNDFQGTEVWVDAEELQGELGLGDTRRRGRPKKTPPPQQEIVFTGPATTSASRPAGFGALAGDPSPGVAPERRAAAPSQERPPEDSEVVTLTHEANGEEWLQITGQPISNPADAAAEAQLVVERTVEVPGAGQTSTAWGIFNGVEGWWLLRRNPGHGWFVLPVAKRAQPAPEEGADASADAPADASPAPARLPMEPRSKEDLQSLDQDGLENLLSAMTTDELAAQFEAVVGYPPEARIGSYLLKGIEDAIKVPFVPLSHTNLVALGEGLQAHLERLDLDQLREQWQVLTGKQSRASLPSFLIRQITDHLGKEVAE